MPIILVAGDLLNMRFHETKLIAEDIVDKDMLLNFEEKGLVEAEWLEYLEKLKGRMNNSVLRFKDPSEPVVLHSVLGYMGGLDELLQWAKKKYNYPDPRVHEGYGEITHQLSAMTKTSFAQYVNGSPGQFVELIFDIEDTLSADNRVVIQLYTDKCPKTCANFLALCTGDSKTEEKLSYVNSPIHRIVKDGWIQGGDIVDGSGKNGKSIYGDTFADEAFNVPHDRIGVVAMANSGPHTNSSQFYITMKELPFFNKKNVAFGQVVCGFNVLRRINEQPTVNQRPARPVVISSCGEVSFTVSPGTNKGVEDHQVMNTPRSVNRRDATLIVIGLDEAGKSTVVKNFISTLPKDMYFSPPTIGFERESMRYDHFDLVFYGLGGGEGFRGIWTHYYDEVYGVVFVIDSSDSSRFEEARTVLMEAVNDPRVVGKPILIFANKQDQPNAITATELSLTLKIDNIKKTNPCRVFKSIALPTEYNHNAQESDPSLFDGMSWLCRQIESNYGELTRRVKKDVIERKEKEQNKKK